MNPAGTLWQSELSREVLNHTPNQEKREGPGTTRYLQQDSVPCTSFFKASNCGCFRKDSSWWTQMATPEQLLFLEGPWWWSHLFCLFHLWGYNSYPRWGVVTYLYEQWLIVEVKIGRVMHSYVWILALSFISYDLGQVTQVSLCLCFLITKMRLTVMSMLLAYFPPSCIEV